MTLGVRKTHGVGLHVPFTRRASSGEAFFRVDGDWLFQPALLSHTVSAGLYTGAEIDGLVYAVANDQGATGFILEVRCSSGEVVGIAPAATTGEVIEFLLKHGAGVLFGNVVEADGAAITARLMYFGESDGPDDSAEAGEWVLFDRARFVSSVLNVDVNALGGLPN